MLKKIIKQPKIMVYSLIAYTPLIVLLLAIALFSIRFYNINSIDYDKDYIQFDDYLRSESESERIPNFYDLEKITSNITFKNNFLIYIYGGSSTIIPEGSTFHLYLQTKLQNRYDNNVTIINYGAGSVDSHAVKNIMKRSIGIRKPDLVIIYTGHNDYTNAYSKFIKPNYYLIKEHFIEDLLVFLNLDKLIWPKSKEDLGYNFDWFLKTKLEPLLINFFQKIRLINLNQEEFQKYNDIILDYYSKNIFEIINLSEKNNIPIVFITPIGNLEAEPFGIYRITTKNYNLGIKEKDYSKRIEYLAKAKDSEVFTQDTRAKSDLNNFLRSLNKKNIYVLDLEKELRSKKFSFSYVNFYDYFHFLPETHARIASAINLFISENNLIKVDVKD